MVKTPEHQFIWFLVKLFGKLPDDVFFENINPYLKIWLYASWINEQEMDIEKLRNQSIFLGSFFNPEMAQRIVKNENPDFSSNNEEFEKAAELVHEKLLETTNKQKKQRVKRKVVE